MHKTGLFKKKGGIKRTNNKSNDEEYIGLDVSLINSKEKVKVTFAARLSTKTG